MYGVSHECSICCGESHHSAATTLGAEVQSRVWSNLRLSKGITSSKAAPKGKQLRQEWTGKTSAYRSFLSVFLTSGNSGCIGDRLSYTFMLLFQTVCKLKDPSHLRFQGLPGSQKSSKLDTVLLNNRRRLPQCQSNWRKKWQMKLSFDEHEVMCMGHQQPLP